MPYCVLPKKRITVRKEKIPHFYNQYEQKIEQNGKFLLPCQLSRHEGKMTVVLDMDETLIHTVFDDPNFGMYKGEEEELATQKKISTKADMYDNTFGGLAVYFRPGLHRFLYKLSEFCEVVLWTASDQEYADPILNYIDPNGDLLPYRLYREHTIQMDDMEYVKDLKLLGRDMKRTLLIDNLSMVAQTSPRNCFIIEDFTGDPDDQQLEKIFHFLIRCNGLSDIRPNLEKKLKKTENKKNKPNEKKEQC